MGRVRFGAVRASGPCLALVLPAATLLASPTPGHAQVIQSVTCLVEGSARYGINTEGITVTSGTAASDANATVYAQSLGANGGVQGGNAGAVTITADGTISAPAAGTAAVQGPGGLAVPQSAAVWAQSLGGCGNVAPGNAAGAGGTAGAVTVTANADTVIDLGPNVAGIYALSAGGQGAGYTYDATHDLGPGGDAGTVTVNFAGTINGQGADNAYGIYALSAGGASGATDSKYSVSGGDAGNVYVTLSSGARIDVSGDASIGVFAASVGGLSWYADNGTYGGHQNGDGADVTVTTQSDVTINTSGELGIGILALSTGGNSTTSQQPPDSLQENGENAKPTDYAPPGNAGDVQVNNQATITTAGDVSVGIAAISATGGRGAGQVMLVDGTYVIDQVGQVGPGAGSPGTVTVTNSATITTSGIGAIGILGLSLGGAGGVMDSGPGLLSLLGGTAAGTGAAGNTVEITDTGTIVTTGTAAIGILAESVGGGGGTATGTHGVVAVGTNGGAGGNGGQVEVEKLGGSIGTSGDGAFGILAQSIGGGGGNGANASGLWAAVGGAGGASGDGGEVDVTLQSSTVQTAGDFAAGVGAQSVGGGGGNGGYAKSYSLVAPVSTAIGGTGSGGGAGGVIDITVTDSSIGTSGAHAPALLAQSVGGGGGTGGAAAVYSTGVSLVVTTAIGGDASNGGAGGAVTVTGTQATYATTGLDSVGILAQSVGGGGGNGGSALSRSEALPASDLPTVSIDTSVGGTGGAGGAGGAATVSNIGKVSTQGDGSIGILAQSVGGGGGNGADASAFARSIEGALPNVKISVAVGGKGGAGGDGAAVSVTNGNPNDPCGARCAGTVTTEGDNAAGILAQSIGGGGGNGGAGNGSVSSPNLGGDTGTAIDATIGVGGTGGDGGTGGTVAVENTAGSLVQTYGSGSQGILAQSIGGGGGNAGGGTAAGSGDNVVMNVSVGGAGGTGAYAQTVTVTNEGTIATGQLVEGNGGAYTTGGDAVGILAQSIGGGGGAAGSSDAAATISTLFQIEDLLNAPSNSYIGSVTIGGTGGTGGDGGTVQVTNTGGITTLGERAYGILAQSIGGGGGTGGAATSAANSVAGGPDGGKSGTYSAIVSVGGSGGAAGQGGTVTVQGFGTVLTAGYGAVGILAQSVGGGGGVGAEGSVNNTTTLGIGGDWNGKGSAGGDGSAVTVSTGPVTTLGDDAHGIVAQSVGGGGGLGSAGCTNSTEASAGGIATTLCYGNTAGLTGSFAPWNDASSYTIQMGGGAGASGAGGDVIVTVDEALSTSGARSMGVIAQSIGGGGGLVTVPAGNTASVQLQAAPGANGGASGTVTVTETATGAIATTGAGAWGILAQSLYGGGGFAGDPSLPAQALVSNTLTTSGSVGTAGAVTVNVAGGIATTGANAHGVVAQSVGGGGGIANSAANDSLVFGNSAQIYGISEGEHAATGGAVTVTVAAGGSIKATGAGSIGILAQSTGVASSQNGYQTPPIDITIDGTVLGGTLTGATAFQPVAGLVLSGGGYASADWSAANQVTIGAGGSLGTVDGANGWAIVGSDGYTSVTNYGTVTGGINLGASFGIVTNYGLLNTGTQMNLASLVNDGTVNVAGKGAVGTTQVVGSYTQGASGTLAADIDALAVQQADLLTVDGKAELLGTIVPNAKNLLYGSYQVLGAGSLDAHVSAPSSLLFDWGVAVYDNQIWLEPIADFTPAGVTLSPAEASLADYLGDGWNGIGSPTFFAPLFGALSKIGDGSSYVAALKALSPEASQAQATALLSNAGTVLGAALSCPVFVTSGTLLGEDECAWAKVTGSWFSQSQTRDTQGFDVSQVTYRLGAQKELSPGWYLGGSFGAGPTSSSSDNGSSGDGYTVDGSVSVKHVAGPWLFAGSLAVAHGSYDNSRLVELTVDGMAPAVLDSDSSMTLVAGRLRAGYEFTFPDWYIRPYADLDFVYANAPGYREQGASLYALDVQGGDYTSVVLSPMLEIGGRFALDDAILRPYLSAGVSFNSNDTRVVSARFAGASAETGSFETYLNMPAVIGTVMAGLTLYKAGGFEARAEYAFSAGDSFQAQSGSLRLAYHF
ncbi:autotransporter outer membrane beta-barrel domain-containing protein [Ancylobacter sonchi]|uniref:autotransporter outer membrane beta-barrel domain-containing protein n=1 Tax=Ancylobacter sonchi TaxID=1937790 RepID=UPI001BD6AC56|nr:autotransporter outer membrane beta-barrel domain-containing protein [Ancylobacter sonchi]MBS7532506.1 autotransporter outer membrane beta-barrel domain-containing protein [Ancylobacter sonchi]